MRHAFLVLFLLSYHIQAFDFVLFASGRFFPPNIFLYTIIAIKCVNFASYGFLAHMQGVTRLAPFRGFYVCSLFFSGVAALFSF